jgi:ribosomal protein S18 acetylase RimI-like enzyme
MAGSRAGNQGVRQIVFDPNWAGWYDHTKMFTPIRYFKRYRMELALGADRPALDPLPHGYFWQPWDEELIDAHAATKYECFRGELDTQVFPSLATPTGCEQLMRAIRLKPGFLAGATWLIGYGNEFVATVQGVRAFTGWGAIQNVGVVPEHRSQGLGRQLMLQALNGFAAAGLPGAFLEVTAQNSPAVRLYRSLGFRCRKTVYKPVEAPQVYSLVADEVALR